MQSAHQVAHDDLRAGLHREVQWCEFGCVLHSGVDVSLHADQEKHTLDVRVLHSYVKEVASLVVNLSMGRSEFQSNCPNIKYTSIPCRILYLACVCLFSKICGMIFVIFVQSSSP